MLGNASQRGFDLPFDRLLKHANTFHTLMQAFLADIEAQHEGF
jgi:hypothetical protein